MKSRRMGKISPMNRRFDNVASVLALDVLSALKGEVPALVRSQLERGEFSSVVSQDVDPSAFCNAADFADAYLAVELMSKYPNFDTGIDRKQVAVAKFMESELNCSEVNKKLTMAFPVVNGALSPYTPEAFILNAQEKIRRVLGPFSWDLAERYFGFGPGATSSLKARFGDAYFKFRAQPCTTRSNAVLAYTCISRIPAWYSHVVSLTGKAPEEVESLPMVEKLSTLFQITEGNRICTVPKNAKTERIIAIEPTMNGYVQHGIGGLIRSRLRRVGVDLNDQSKNQELARLGSLDDSLATVDLKAASDSISMELVKLLLPPDWVIAIEQARSPVGVLPDGRHIVYQKVSSMGCGFTFELESLIFWALLASVNCILRPIDRRFAVYGDDIIISQKTVRTLLWLLKYLGFSPNMKKTFLSGPFRESCGKHYFNGVDVTPIYIREDIDTPERAIWFANQIRRYARLSWGLDARFRHVYEKAVGKLPAPLRRPSISDGYGDAALIGDFDEVLPRRLPSFNEGYVATGWVRVARTRQFCDVPYLLRSLSMIGERQPSMVDYLVSLTTGKKRTLALPLGNGVPIPEPSPKWRIVKIPVAQWKSYGPWLGPN